MPIHSLYSKVDEVQSLLIEIQNNLHYLPPESQNLVATELEHFAIQLRNLQLENGKQLDNDASVRSRVKSEVEPTQQLQGSESWMSLALKQAGAAAWKWDLIQNTIQWSSEINELLGVDLAEEVYDPQMFFERIHPDDRKLKLKEIDDTIQAGGSFYLEFRIIRGDGKLIWLSSSGMVEHDLAGRPIRAFGFNQDITDRKRIREALHESEERERAKVAELKALMDAVPAMIWISRDPQCKEMVGNRYGYEFLNMWEEANISKTAPDTDLAQQPYRNFKNGQEISNNELPMQVAASTGVRTSNYEFDLVFNNGVTRNVLGNVVPLTDLNGKPSGAVAAFVDITDRKRIEDELRRSEHRFRVALASAPMTVFTTDENLRYTWIYNLRHGFTEEQMLGKRADEVLAPEDVTELVKLQQAVIETGKTVQQEFKMRISDAWFHYIAALDPILDHRGQVTGLIGAAFDITKQRQLENVQQKNEIRSATQRHLLQTRENERVKIARDIHDGPLQTLIAMVFNIDLFKDKIRDQRIKAEIESLGLSLKNAIQELRQVISELRPPALADFGMAQAIREYAEDICEKSPGIELVCDLGESAPNLREELSLALYRISQEALQNIVRHSKASKVIIQLLLDNDQVLLTIKDNGVGFSVINDFSELIADKHYGLTGMTERAEAVGGKLQISSEPGEGTEIKVFVPYSRA